ncbi:threonine--tRNA ligase [Miltoncostaea oceani]|uniref:threonine--tRNA ligase n=1 Tax=Miltoncostaea oceani TaxID=2843216 RepID=UPI001C3E71AD|nr:threonine--tRNA ligase [Miltoncostaea oceani]
MSHSSPAHPRSHQQLGVELDLFHFSPEAAGCFWHPRGQRMREALLGLWREQLACEGFEEVCTPVLHSASSWEASGHLDKYSDDMYLFSHGERGWGLKPMSCPAHMAIFGSRLRSWRELPVRFAEAGLVHRNEPSGSLLGLLRARQFVQDDSHLFCAPDQVGAEVARCLEMSREAYRLLGLEISAQLSLRPALSFGSEQDWAKAQAALREGLRAAGVDAHEVRGEGAFYGPKIDLFADDALGRRWQMGSVQLDLQLPVRLGLSYVGPDNAAHHPWVLHRAGFGSIERMVAIMLEASQGDLPVWCAPVPVMVVPLDDEASRAHAVAVAGSLRQRRVGVEVEAGAGGLGARIRRAVKARAPYMLIIGPDEAAQGAVQVRMRGASASDQRPWGEVLDEIGRAASDRASSPLEVA